jgi:diadenosine tetraphosphate (Ap4A) HIT family hydrolase
MPQPLGANPAACSTCHMFELDPAFPPTSRALAELPLCHARLQADARYPWIVLIPRVEAARELEDLAPEDLARLTAEILAAGRAVRAAGQALGLAVEKLNVGALGNVTPQLHVHVVGRRAGDPAWPGPVWGHGEAGAFTPSALEAALAAARQAFAADGF